MYKQETVIAGGGRMKMKRPYRCSTCKDNGAFCEIKCLCFDAGSKVDCGYWRHKNIACRVFYKAKNIFEDVWDIFTIYNPISYYLKNRDTP